jgi:hypothetical protein
MTATYTVNWDTKPPTEPGLYWFYGYTNGDHESKRGKRLAEPGWHLCDVVKIQNGTLTTVGGVFDWDRAPMIGHYCRVELPQLPVDAQVPDVTE